MNILLVCILGTCNCKRSISQSLKLGSTLDYEHPLSFLLKFRNGVYELKKCDQLDLGCYGLSSNYVKNRDLAKDDDEKVNRLQSQIVDEFSFAFQKYRKASFGFDEFHPLSNSGQMFSENGVGYLITDVLDTALLMGLKDEAENCLRYIAEELNFEQDTPVNVFETSIRVMGGLLSSHFITNYQNKFLLDISMDLGNRLLQAFDLNTGLPIPTINLLHGNYSYYEQTSTSEATSVQLEFKYLSYLTNNSYMWDLMERSMDSVDKAEKLDGLVPIFIDSASSNFTTDEIRLGSRGDSYYEYLLKQYLLTEYAQEKYYKRYAESVEGIKKNLIGYSVPHKILFIGEIKKHNISELDPKMDHLVCFLAGNLALGATKGYSLREIQRINSEVLFKGKINVNYDDLKLAEKIAETCYRMYTMHKSGLSAEITKFRVQSTGKQIYENDMYVTQYDKHYILRPETVESLFILYRITHNKKYRRWGWQIFKKIRLHAKTENGYCSVADVTQVPTPKIDKMETFFLSETLKYLYLLFSNTSFLPLSQVVFNTEGHVLPRFYPQFHKINRS